MEYVSVNCAALPLLFHAVSDKQPFTTSWDTFLRSLLISVQAMSHLPVCNDRYHLAIIFETAAE